MELSWGIFATGRVAKVFANDLLVYATSRGVTDITHVLAGVASSSSLTSARQLLQAINGPPTCCIYDKYSDLVLNPDIDIVYIASPHSHHFQNAMLALEAGKHVLCEKPITVNADQARKLFSVAARKGLFLMEGMWTRFQPVGQELHRALKYRTIGNIIRVIADNGLGVDDSTEWPPSDRMIRKELGGGALLDLGAYPIHWILQTLRPNHPLDILSTVSKHVETGVDESMSILMRFASRDPTGPDILTIANASISAADNYDGNTPVVRIQGETGEIQLFGPAWRPSKMCVIKREQSFGAADPLGTPQPEATSCERCRNLDLEYIIERTYLGRPAAKRAKRAIFNKSPNSDISNSPESAQDEEKSVKLSDSIRQYLFSGAMDTNLMLQTTRDTNSSSGEEELYHSMTNTGSLIASILAKDASFGAGIQLVSTWDAPLTDLDFIFCPPTHPDSILLCRFLAAFKPTALATSQRVAHQAVKAELYINLAYRIAERLELLPEPERAPFTGTNAIDSVEMERDLILSIQGLQLISDEFLLGDFLTIMLGLGLFYASVLRARSETGESQTHASPDIRREEAIQMGEKVINTLMTTPNDQRDSHFFNFLHHFGARYPDKLQGILAKFVECGTIRLGGNDFHAPVRPIVLEIVSHCKNIIENNLLRFKVNGRPHPHFDKQLEMFTQCAQKLAAMVAIPGSSPEASFSSGCVYSASSNMTYGLCDLMNSLKLQASLVKDWDEAIGVSNMSLLTTDPPMHFNSFEAWNLPVWPNPDPLEQPPVSQNIFDWALQSETQFDETMLSFPNDVHIL
ncbi:uncharacterized protein N7483_001549 [Penicillium malachiteum]|uniref:uncharacterized protein n=1 Tax=Penicillium malachiteum TaxID=1324776 RepID=UPI0025477E49|nr:uncharacterized protein N7483_001549 [Penicillium malachiteum]KAJ5736424.1 hypothetical protein N7483_001549 [Penicillium malachiteum]